MMLKGLKDGSETFNEASEDKSESVNSDSWKLTIFSCRNVSFNNRGISENDSPKDYCFEMQ